MQKLCSECSQPAKFSIVGILSTLGLRQRVQQSSRALLFCDDCLRNFCEHLQSSTQLQCVNAMYTSLIARLQQRSAAENRARE